MSGLTPSEIAYQKAHIDQNRGPQIVAVSGFLIAVTSIIVFSRLIARRWKRVSYGWDDYLALGGLVRLYDANDSISLLKPLCSYTLQSS